MEDRNRHTVVPPWLRNDFVDPPPPVDDPTPPAPRSAPRAAAPRPAVPRPAAPRPADAPRPDIANPVTPVAEPGGRHRAPTIDEFDFHRSAYRAPQGAAWRRAVHRISAGAINPGDSPDSAAHHELVARIKRPIDENFSIAVLSMKGGVGKTTTTVCLGSTLASLRGDRVIAVDANPDLGTLSGRAPMQTRSTIRDLLMDDAVDSYAEVRAYTSSGPSRLEILASERDPAVTEAFSADDYRAVTDILVKHYNLVLTDCGTGLMHSAMDGILDAANALVLVSSPAMDGAKSAAATLDWLSLHGYEHLVASAVVVISAARPGSSTIDLKQLTQHFLSRCRAVHVIPHDDHLAEGSEIDLELLHKRTRRAFIELAATVADAFER